MTLGSKLGATNEAAISAVISVASSAAQPEPSETTPASCLPLSPSYMEIEISPVCVNVFERSGDGKTEALLRLLRQYGLRLEERVSSPCG